MILTHLSHMRLTLDDIDSIATIATSGTDRSSCGALVSAVFEIFAASSRRFTPGVEVGFVIGCMYIIHWLHGSLSEIEVAQRPRSISHTGFRSVIDFRVNLFQDLAARNY
eukprot:sb/3477259/